jgi:hypothetical protein
MLLSLHLTPAPIDEIARVTHPGMASWAIPDTPNRCAECVFWNDLGRSNKQPRRGVPAPRRYTKYFMLTDKAGAAVPASARACRFYQLQEPIGG